MKRTLLAAALLTVAGTQPAFADDAALLEAGLHFAWSFGAPSAESRPTLSLGLYPNDLGWRRLWADIGVEEAARLERPAMLDLRIGSRDAGLHLMGLPLGTHSAGLNAVQGESSGGSFLKPVLIVLAAGVATALVISSAGDAAQDSNPGVNPPGEDTDVCGDDAIVIGDECVVGGDGG